MMRICFFFLLFFYVPTVFASSLAVSVSAKSAILVNAESGQVLYEKNADKSMYPASLTKIATCLYAIEKHSDDWDQFVSCPAYCLKRINKSVKIAHNYRDPAFWLEPDGRSFGIKRGEELIFKDLLYGMMVASGNDAANYLAHHVGGTISRFMRGLNIYLRKLGCHDTYFRNPHGLHHPDHMTTAYDMALITREALKDDRIQKIVSVAEFDRGETNRQGIKTIPQSNLLLRQGRFFYSNAIGMKVGYTSDAGYSLAAVAKEGERTLIAILFDCKDTHQRYRDAIRLFEAAFDEVKVERLLFKKEENVFTRNMKESRHPLKARVDDDIRIAYFPSEEPQVKVEVNWEALQLPISAGDWLGEIHILDEHNNLLSSSALYATESIDKGFWAKMYIALLAPSLWAIIVLLIAVALSVLWIFFGERLRQV